MGNVHSLLTTSILAGRQGQVQQENGPIAAGPTVLENESN
jgi:hypothetical protein